MTLSNNSYINQFNLHFLLKKTYDNKEHVSHKIYEFYNFYKGTQISKFFHFGYYVFMIYINMVGLRTGIMPSVLSWFIQDLAYILM